MKSEGCYASCSKKISQRTGDLVDVTHAEPFKHMMIILSFD